ncbi:MAG: hypothetical protein ABSF55_03070 [Candidatus Staskawiczbacteria bacterium]|jgi:hypothetical protein
MEEHNPHKKYIKQQYCNFCGQRHVAIIPTKKNLDGAEAFARECILQGQAPITLTDETEVLICRNVSCKLFQNFKTDRWWKYKNID